MLITLNKPPGKPALREKTNNKYPFIFDTLYSTGLIVFLAFSFVYSIGRFAEFPIEYILLAINGLLAIYGQVLAIRNNASLHYVSFVFCYLFLSITPLIQIGANHDPVFNMEFILLIATTMSLIFTLIGLFSMCRLNKKKIPPTDEDDKPRNGRYFVLFLVTLITAAFTIFLFWDGLFTSRKGFGLFLSTIFSDQPTASLAMNFLMSIPFFGAAIGFRSALANKRHGWTFAYTFLLMLGCIINNPFINPRYKLAGLVFFFIDYLFRGKKLRLLVALVIMGALSAPLFNAFREEIPYINPAQQEKSFGNTFLSYDYDAFQIACYTVVMVDQQGLSWGSNIAGALLFFVPRTFWPEKPKQTSHLVYDTMIKYREVGTPNLSTPLMAEGYLAFSWLGVLLISIIYWAAISKIIVKSRQNCQSLTFLSRGVLVGLIFIFLRGTLIVGVSAVVGSFLAALIPWLCFGNKKTVTSRPSQ